MAAKRKDKSEASEGAVEAPEAVSAPVVDSEPEKPAEGGSSPVYRVKGGKLLSTRGGVKGFGAVITPSDLGSQSSKVLDELVSKGILIKS